MEKINLKAMLLERFKGATVIDGLIGYQTINGKQLEPKRITSFADFSIPELATLDIKDLATPMLDKFEKDILKTSRAEILYRMYEKNEDCSRYIIGIWGEFEITADPYTQKDKIRFICNAYLDAIVK